MQLPNTQVGHGDGQRQNRKTVEDGSYHTAQVGPRDGGRKKSKKWIGYDFDLIWIEIRVKKFFFFQGMSSLAL